MRQKKNKRKNFNIHNTSVAEQGYTWGGNTPLWEEESEELADDLEDLRERANG
ncbi:MAG: hypothetical protein MJB12_20590 [Firmicutes bacterium]|nr:hypothetical protein [Bacillota bacterium]